MQELIEHIATGHHTSLEPTVAQGQGMNQFHIDLIFLWAPGARWPLAISDGLLPDDALSPAAHANLDVCSQSRYGQALIPSPHGPSCQHGRRAGGRSLCRAGSAGSLPVPLRPQAEGIGAARMSQ
jgi:hypothetical protein